MHGNNEADKVAKSAFEFGMAKFKIPSQKTVSLDFDEEKAHEGHQGNFKISKLVTFN